MANHIVMWNFKDEIKEEDKAVLMSVMEENLKALVGKIPGLLTVEFVRNPIKPSSTHEIALVTTLEKEDDIAIYAKHPEHVRVADTYVRPYVKDRACLDY